MSASKVGVKHLLGDPLLALPTNISLKRKGLPGTIPLAYCEHSQITAVKSFITLGPERQYFMELIAAHCEPNLLNKYQDGRYAKTRLHNAIKLFSL